jgi:hypothetical protein
MAGTEIIWNRKDFYCLKNRHETKESATLSKGLFLYNMVKRDAELFLESQNGTISLPDREPVNKFNPKFDASKEIEILDIKSAFWKIAYNLGIIRDATYNGGIKEVKITLKGNHNILTNLKSVRNSALANLGTDKKYKKIIAGELTEEEFCINGHKGLQDVYKLIRYTCFRHMKKVSELLGDDFCKWETDCIVFAKSDKNKKIVTDYFKSHNLEVE